MKIRYTTYPTAFTTPGGGEMQIMKTLSAVQACGVDCELLDIYKPILRQDFDLLHLFSVCYSIELFVNWAEAVGMPFAVSPILWPTQYEEQERNRIRHILLRASLILPNSVAEKNKIIELLNIPDNGQFFVVPNGFETNIYSNIERNLETIQNNKVLCIANIDQRKNLDRLAEACENLNLFLVLAGAIRDLDYFNKLITKFPKVIEYHGSFENGSKQHLKLLQEARLFALPSYYETPGIAAIEAGSAGVPVLVTEVGAAPEYFGDHATYCNPLSLDSIIIGLNFILNKQPVLSRSSRDHYQAFSWKKSAKATVAAYQQVLNQN